MKPEQQKEISELKEKIASLEKKICEMEDGGAASKISEENSWDIIETFRYGVIYTTLTGDVITINKNLEKIVDIPSDELVGRNIIILANKYFPPADLLKILPGLKSLISGKNIPSFQVPFRQKVIEVIPNINLKSRRLTAIIRDVTESSRIQNELEISEARLQRAELASRSGNWEFQIETGIMYGSEGARILYGVDDFRLEYAKVKNIPLPEYREQLDKALQELVKEGKPYNIEFKIRNAKTGKVLDIHSIARYDKAKKTLFGVIRDITEQKTAEEEIKRKNLELARFLEITLELMETVDKETVLRKIVEGAVSLIGLDTGAIYLLDGKDVFLEVTTPPLPEGFPYGLRRARLNDHPRVKEAIENTRTVIENDITSSDVTAAEKIVIDARDLKSVIYVPLLVQKEARGVLIIGTSGHTHKFNEHEIDLLRTLSNIASLTLENTMLFRNLTVARDKALESDRLKTAFLHNISHEIRTPLNAIVGFSGFLKQTDLSEKERNEYIDIIFQSNNQLLSIINDILNISQIETGQAILRETEFDIKGIINTLHSQFLPDAIKKGLEFSLNPPHGIREGGSIIIGDEGKLLQILSNLLSNSLKFTHQGRIDLSYGLKDGLWEFTVADTGIGIAPEEQERVFDRFYQVNNMGNRSFGGTGLGLSISRAFATMMGGNLKLVSVPCHGTSFILTIPDRRAAILHKEIIMTEAQLPMDNQTQNTIVVVEDEDSNFYLINAILKTRSYKIVRASNGKEAVDYCLTADPDLILMDLKMSVLDGISATTEILKFKPDLKIIAQSAYAQTAEKEKALNSGCIDYITKPFTREKLLEIIDMYLK